jgi:hypothetical protein
MCFDGQRVWSTITRYHPWNTHRCKKHSTSKNIMTETGFKNKGYTVLTIYANHLICLLTALCRRNVTWIHRQALTTVIPPIVCEAALNTCRYTKRSTNAAGCSNTSTMFALLCWLFLFLLGLLFLFFLSVKNLDQPPYDSVITADETTRSSETLVSSHNVTR